MIATVFRASRQVGSTSRGASFRRPVYIPGPLADAAPTEVATNHAPFRERYLAVLARLGPLLLFALLIAVAGWRYRNWVNADGTFYIRKAMYIRWGMWPASVSAYWSPGLSWCIALLVTPFTDPVSGLHAARWVLAVFGLFYVAASAVLLRRLLGLSRIALAGWGAATIAFCAVPLAAYKITPDLLLGFALLAYLAIVVRGDFLRRPGRAILAGVAAGAAFLCKAYALPFFLTHFTMTLIWHAWNAHHAALPQADRPNGGVAKRVIVSAILGVGVFAIFAVPWIAVISAKYHHLVISTVMAPHHAAVGPAEFGAGQNTAHNQIHVAMIGGGQRDARHRHHAEAGRRAGLLAHRHGTRGADDDRVEAGGRECGPVHQDHRSARQRARGDHAVARFGGRDRVVGLATRGGVEHREVLGRRAAHRGTVARAGWRHDPLAAGRLRAQPVHCHRHAGLRWRRGGIGQSDGPAHTTPDPPVASMAVA